jgi:O-antigen/teichoic acid export membrane protein
MRETAVAGNNIAKLSQSYSHNMTIILAIILPSCVGLAIMGEDIGILLLDDQFLISGSIIIPLACVTMAIDAFILNSVNHAFHITQKMKYPLYILLVMALIELAIKLIWWDISMMQILYINICVSTLALIASIILAKRVMKFSIPWQNIMIIAMATTAMGYSVNLYGVASGYIDLVIKMIIGIGVYGSITYVLFRTYTKTLSLR